MGFYRTGTAGILMLLLFILCVSCEKEFDKYYSVPEDLIGTVLDVLEEDGNYDKFIRAVELAGYDDVLGATGNFTVFAPDDDAFDAFLTEKGYGSLEDIPEEELKGIVFYHIIFWAYSKFMLLYGLGIQDAEIDYSTENFKKPSRYTPPLTTEYDTLGREYTVYHETKFLPVYSDEFFRELDLDAQENYSFLYPQTTYAGFHVDRAAITEHDIPAQNGWIHKINRVLEPPDNHEEILRSKPEYSSFHELIELNTLFEYSSAYTTAQDNEGDIDEDGEIDSLFLKMNRIFPSGTSPGIENVANNGKQNILTLFAPTNNALQSFFMNRTRGYSSIGQIGEYWLNWYLSHYIGTNYWPSEFDELTEEWQWDLTSSLVDCNITEADVHFSKMASNGPFCGIDKYFLPKIFESVAQPIFGDSEYEWFCDLLIFYLADKLLNEENLEITLFAPSNAAISASGYAFRNGPGGWGLYSDSDPLAPVPREIASDIVKTHIVFGELTQDDLEPGTFIETSQNTYIGVKEDGIFGGGDVTPAAVGIAEPVGDKGVFYKIDRMLVAPRFSIFEMLSNPNVFPQYRKFYQLCRKANLMLLDENQNPISLDNISTGTQYTCFFPTNEAITLAEENGSLPQDPDSLQQLVRYHFVEGVIFPDGKKSGEFNTTRIDEESGYLFTTIEVINQKNDLSVKDNLGNISRVISPNHMVTDGVIHQVDSILRYW